MSEKFQLVILIDGRSDTYTVWDHNLTADKAREAVSDLRRKLLHAFTVNQLMRHEREDAEACRSCRKDVQRAYDLPSRPRFQRRDQE